MKGTNLDKINPEATDAINEAISIAAGLNHKIMTAEHLLLTLISKEGARDGVLACGASPDEVISKVKEYLESDELEDIASKQETMSPEDVKVSEISMRIIKRSMIYMKAQNSNQKVDVLQLLSAMLAENECYARTILSDLGVSRFDLINWANHGIKKTDRKRRDFELVGTGDARAPRRTETSTLKEFATNLNEKAKEGKIDELIGRTSEVDRTAKILCRRSKNNPIFVGDAGVGKTAIAEGLAKKIVDGAVPASLKNCVIYALDMTSMIAGSRYRGDFEERMKKLLDEVADNPDVILFIDEIHAAMGTGSGSQGSLDAGNILKPALARGDMRCIGATTQAEYRKIFEKDAAMARRFQKVVVCEPTRDQAVGILSGAAPVFEQHHGVEYTQDIIEAAVDLSIRYINHRKLPDKAIDILDEAGAIYSSGEKTAPAGSGTPVVTLSDIEATVSQISGVAVKSASKADRAALKTLAEDLKLSVFGQDEAVSTLSSAIKVAKAGLRKKQKPLGSFLFVGPTGVGKTELAKQLSSTLGTKLLRFDMSEYMEKHAVSRLIGAPPGYVGFEKGGILTEAVEQYPHSILLFDEFEKAHPDMTNLLLQVMDNGILTDSNGREVDFRNTILLMTSNAGVQDMFKPGIGFLGRTEEGLNTAAIEATFSPEFRNRLDAVVPFNPLPESAIGLVVDKMVYELEANLQEAKVSLELTTAARNWLGNKGYDVKMGARPLERVVQSQISEKIADQILFGDLADGGNVRIDLNPDVDELEFSYMPIAANEMTTA